MLGLKRTRQSGSELFIKRGYKSSRLIYQERGIGRAQRRRVAKFAGQPTICASLLESTAGLAVYLKEQKVTYRSPLHSKKSGNPIRTEITTSEGDERTWYTRKQRRGQGTLERKAGQKLSGESVGGLWQGLLRSSCSINYYSMQEHPCRLPVWLPKLKMAYALRYELANGPIATGRQVRAGAWSHFSSPSVPHCGNRGEASLVACILLIFTTTSCSIREWPVSSIILRTELGGPIISFTGRTLATWFG